MNYGPLQLHLAKLRQAYRGSAIAQFIAWWTQELARMIPKSLRDKLVQPKQPLLIYKQLDDWRFQTNIAPAVETLIDDETPNFASRIAAVLSAAEEPPLTVYCLAPQRVLKRNLQLPAAAEDNLRQVLTFEMDRQTPFKAEQVYFDFIITQRQPGPKGLAVTLALTPRAEADADRERLAKFGLSLDVMDVLAADQSIAAEGFNFLPNELRAKQVNTRARINLAMAFAAILLLLMVMAKSVTNREEAVEALRAQVDIAKIEAKRVSDMRKSLTEAIDGANFLMQAKRSRPAVIDLWLEITRRLPDTTTLARLSINGAEVLLQGQSTEAAALISLLQKSKILEAPALQGAITPDARTGKEQFTINLKAKAQKEGGDATTAKS